MHIFVRGKSQYVCLITIRKINSNRYNILNLFIYTPIIRLDDRLDLFIYTPKSNADEHKIITKYSFLNYINFLNLPFSP